MDVALIEHAQHDVDGDERSENEDGFVGQRGLESCGSALEAGVDRGGHADGLFHAIDGRDCISQRTPRRQVEADDGGGELALVADGQLRARLLPVGEHAEWHLRAVARLHIEIVERGGVGLEVGRDLHHHVILVELREDGGDLALAEGIVERVVDVGHGDAQPRSGVAVNDQLGSEALVLQVAGDVGKRGLLAQSVDHLARVGSELGLVGIFERVLELRAAHAVFHGQVLQRLQEELDAFDGGELALQTADHFSG